jgi:sec-independent protein translocase protein TatA
MIGDILQPTHLLLVLVVALLVLGPKRLPEVSRQLGRGIRDFRAAISGEDAEPHDELHHRSQAYEAPPQPFEHQFAHETTETATSHVPEADVSTEPGTNGHVGDPTAETTTGDHQFAHQTAAQPPVQAHVETSATAQPDHSTAAGTAGEHEFAYEQAPSAEKPAESDH